jgi:hypothetical protein
VGAGLKSRISDRVCTTRKGFKKVETRQSRPPADWGGCEPGRDSVGRSSSESGYRSFVRSTGRDVSSAFHPHFVNSTKCADNERRVGENC